MILDVIKLRRSVRQFLKKPVPSEVLFLLLEAAQWAPSGGNSQPWLFVVIQEYSNIQKVKMFSPGLQGDPAALFVLCVGPARENTAVMDISMAAQNVMLTATEKGVGSCAIRSFDQQALQSLLNLPSYVMPELIISLGYPAKSATPPRRRSIEEFVHWERYGGQPNE